MMGGMFAIKSLYAARARLAVVAMAVLFLAVPA